MDSPKDSAEESKPQVLLRRKVFDGVSWSPWEVLYHRPAPSSTSTNPPPFVHNFSINTQTTGRRNGRKKKQRKVSGGQLCIFPNLLSVLEQQQITSELLHDNESAATGEPSSSDAAAPTANYFRQYQVQNQDEPRTHFLLHSEASENFDERQPGYHYASVKMKARPLQNFPEIHGLAKRLEEQARAGKMAGAAVPEDETFWNIGVNPVLYRDGRDRIGDHADDDQKEQLIWTVLVASPSSTTRRVRIRRKNKQLQEDEQLELFLDAGDSYSMDGLMQKFYVHSVPCDKKSVATTDAQQPTQQQQQQEGHDSSAQQQLQQQQQEQQRIALVLRRGNACMIGRDSGKPFASLLPRVPIPYIFGNHMALEANPTTLNGPTLMEAATYTRTELSKMGAHHSLQKGVSGSRQIGCDAIIVSGRRADGLGCDQLHRLVYAANGREGARAILTNYNTKDDSKPIRVFRSSVLLSDYRALANNKNTSASSKAAQYRYDGLYRVEAAHYINTGSRNNNIFYRVDDPSKHTALKSLPSDRTYLFTLARCDHHNSIADGVNDADKTVDQEQLLQQQHFRNVMTTDQLVGHAIQQGSLSSQAKNLRKLQPQQLEWTAFFSNVLPECNDPSKISQVPKKKKATTVRKKKAANPANLSSSKVQSKHKKKPASTTARKKRRLSDRQALVLMQARPSAPKQTSA